MLIGLINRGDDWTTYKKYVQNLKGHFELPLGRNLTFWVPLLADMLRFFVFFLPIRRVLVGPFFILSISSTFSISPIVALRVRSPAARIYQAVRRIIGRTDKWALSVKYYGVTVHFRTPSGALS